MPRQIDDFDLEFSTLAALSEVNADIEDEAADIAHGAARESLTYLHGNSPRGEGPKAGSYAHGWTQEDGAEEGEVTSTVHNRTDWQLTHLLEGGHESYNQYGGPYGFVDPAKPEGHIAAAAERGERYIDQRLGGA